MARRAKSAGRGAAPPPAPKPVTADHQLWQWAVRDAKPLGGRKVEAPRAPPTPIESDAESPSPPAGPGHAGPRRPDARAAGPALPELREGEAPGLDKRNADRLRRGLMPVEARVDLHGMTQSQARAALDGFIGRAAGAGRRCVLVITGKGTRSPAGEGVLRAAVPAWLNHPANRAHILAYCRAQPRDGGGGALYVLLRRRRTVRE